jgi:hypothetical protein
MKHPNSIHVWMNKSMELVFVPLSSPLLQVTGYILLWLTAYLADI